MMALPWEEPNPIAEQEIELYHRNETLAALARFVSMANYSLQCWDNRLKYVSKPDSQIVALEFEAIVDLGNAGRHACFPSGFGHLKERLELVRAGTIYVEAIGTNDRAAIGRVVESVIQVAIDLGASKRADGHGYYQIVVPKYVPVTPEEMARKVGRMEFWRWYRKYAARTIVYDEEAIVAPPGNACWKKADRIWDAANPSVPACPVPA